MSGDVGGVTGAILLLQLDPHYLRYEITSLLQPELMETKMDPMPTRSALV